MRLPSGCNNVMHQTTTPHEWFQDPHGTSSATYATRVAAFNSYCGRSDAEQSWAKCPAPLAFAISQSDPSSPITSATSKCQLVYNDANGPCKLGSNKAASDAFKAASPSFIKSTSDENMWAAGWKYGCTQVDGMHICGMLILLILC